MKCRILIVSTMLLLSGCGVAETAGVAAAEANAAAQQAKEGEKLKQQIEDDLAAIQQQAADTRASVDEAN